MKILNSLFLLLLLTACEWKDHPNEIPVLPKELADKEIACIGNAKYQKFVGEGFFLMFDKDGKVYPC